MDKLEELRNEIFDKRKEDDSNSDSSGIYNFQNSNKV